jgi:hypothetical protein
VANYRIGTLGTEGIPVIERVRLSGAAFFFRTSEPCQGCNRPGIPMRQAKEWVQIAPALLNRAVFLPKSHLNSVLTHSTGMDPKIFSRTFDMEFDVSTLFLHP